MNMRISSPERVSHSYTQTLNAPADKIFPLLCPVMETKWVNGWNPVDVFTQSGHAERDCIFVNPDNSVWVITGYQPENHYIEFIKFVPGVVVGRIEIQLSEKKSGESLADITYGYTAIGSKGKDFLRGFSGEYFVSFMQTWEAELNHFLKTGTKKTASI